MLVFGTEMHVVTFVFLLLEIAMFFYQLIYFLSRPQEENRFWYLILLLLLIFYNITGGLFPDNNISISIITQNILAYGSGFIMASYITFYFYKAYKLEQLRFHALYGIHLFLILPFLIFFVIIYSINGNLEMAIDYGIFIPAFYSIYLLIIIIRATTQNYKKHKIKLAEVIIICCAIIPWALMPYLAYGNASQLLEVTVCNGGFLIMTILFIIQSIDKSKEEYHNLQDLHASLTERVKERTYQLERLNEQRTHNFINLVHETKTPLTLVNNYLEEYITKHGPGEEINIIKGGINKLTRDINNLFDLERFKKGLTVYNHNHIFNFSEILKDSLTLFKLYCQKKNIFCFTDIDEEAYLKADSNAINRIVNNLIENAIKFTNSGGKIEIILKVKKETLCFGVYDTGPGIPVNQQKKIFEPYFQINNETSGLQGMGLGLPIVKNVIETLGGRIMIKSNPAKEPGTKVVVVLRRHYLTPENPVSRSSGLPQPLYLNEGFDIADTPLLANRPSILLVEDNKAMLQFIKKKLQQKYNIFNTLNGVEALKKLHELPVIPDLIISDIMMDKMDGYSFAKAVSEQIKYSHIPIIFLSARSAPTDKLKGLRLGAIDFIQKPFSSEELLQKIDSVLENISRQKRAVFNSAISHLKSSQSSEGIAPGAQGISSFDKNCKLYNLTSREIDIIKLIRQGAKYKTIAEILFISDRTVTTHVQNIFEKVGVSNKVELLRKIDS